MIDSSGFTLTPIMLLSWFCMTALHGTRDAAGAYFWATVLLFMVGFAGLVIFLAWSRVERRKQNQL